MAAAQGSDRVTRKLAPYGSACASCSRAKIKCIPTDNDSSICTRCQRLKRDCVMGQPRKPKGPAVAIPTKQSKLEAKLDGIVSLLASVTRNGTLLADVSLTGNSNPTQAHSDTEIPQVLSHSLLTPLTGSHTSPQAFSNTESPSEASHPLARGASILDSTLCQRASSYEVLRGIGSSEADEALRTFRTQMLRRFPIISLSEHVTAQELSVEQPFLWLCIMGVTARSTARRKGLEATIKQTIAQRILIDNEKSSEMLWGIVIYVTWLQNWNGQPPSYTGLIQLALGQVYDLSLHKSELQQEPDALLNYEARPGQTRKVQSKPRTLNDRRMTLHCFLITSVLSFFFQRVDSLRWTPYLEKSLGVVASSEHPDDLLLYHLVRIQLFNEEMAQLQREVSDFLKLVPQPTSRIGLVSLQMHVKELKRSVPARFQENEIIRLSLLHAEFNALEIASSKAFADESANIQRVECLNQCLQATLQWFNIYLSFPPSVYIALPLLVLAQLGRCIMVAYRLSTFEDPSWDLTLVRQTVDFSAILNKVAEYQMLASKELLSNNPAGSENASEDWNCHSRTAHHLFSMKTWWDNRLATEAKVAAEDLGMTTDIPMFELEDDWLRDVSLFWEHNFDVEV